MLKVLYEDDEILVVIKPAGVESQAAKRFAPDMVSEVKKHLVINKSCTPGKEPYVGVIHRLDKPVSGVMVYAKMKRAAAALSEQVQSHKMKKIYTAVVHGRPVNMVDNYVDYMVKTPDGNYSQVVDKGITGAKKAELSYEVLKTIDGENSRNAGNGAEPGENFAEDWTPSPDPCTDGVSWDAAVWGYEIWSACGNCQT